MKILLISENSIEIQQYIKLYEGDYVESVDDIHIKFSIADAKTFVETFLINAKKHIDFVIADFNTDSFYNEFVELTSWFRESSTTYSQGNFQLRSIPVFLMNNMLGYERLHYEQIDYEIDNVFDGLVFKPEDYKRIGVGNNSLANGLKRWLDKLASDLDDLDMNHSEDLSKLNVKIFRAMAHKLRVLSPDFDRQKKSLDYTWIGNKKQIIESTGDDYAKLLKTYSQNPSLRNEKQIHQFLIKYNHLLKSEDFHKSIYEQHFYYNAPYKRRYVEVDFLNITHSYSLQSHQHFEVKLPNQRFFSKTDGELLSVAKRYLQQIGNKYGQYFSSQDNLVEITKRLANHQVTIESLNFQYALLMGRDEDRQQNIAGLNIYISRLSQNANLLTYDDLLKRHQYLHQRITQFGI